MKTFRHDMHISLREFRELCDKARYNPELISNLVGLQIVDTVQHIDLSFCIPRLNNKEIGLNDPIMIAVIGIEDDGLQNILIQFEEDCCGHSGCLENSIIKYGSSSGLANHCWWVTASMIIG